MLKQRLELLRDRREALRSLCLIQAGIVRLGPGPNPSIARTGNGWTVASTALWKERRIEVDFLVGAHVGTPQLDARIDPISRSLRSWAAPHGGDPRHLSLDRHGRLLGDPDTTAPAVAVFGPPAEGASYYNNYVLWPGTWSRLLTDIDRVVGPLIGSSP